MRRVFIGNRTVEGLPATPDVAVEVAAAGYGVCLDPAMTAAYATVGVCVDSLQASPIILRPGEFLYWPAGFRRLYLFNTLGTLIARALPENRPAGRLALLVTETNAEAVHFADLGYTAPRGGGQVNQGEVA